jgi:hypothetical protein
MTHWKPDTPSAWPAFEAKEEGAHKCPRCNEVLLTRIKRRDWEAIINALCAVGVSTLQIAAAVGRSDTAVHNWRLGGEPKESDARKVLALYRRHVGDI